MSDYFLVHTAYIAMATVLLRGFPLAVSQPIKFIRSEENYIIMISVLYREVRVSSLRRSRMNMTLEIF